MDIVALRNGDSAEFQSAPRRDADPLNLQRHLKTLAEFLLNLLLCCLRLHIEVCPEQRYQKNRNHDQEQPSDGSPEADHSRNITQRVIAVNHACRTPLSC